MSDLFMDVQRRNILRANGMSQDLGYDKYFPKANEKDFVKSYWDQYDCVPHDEDDEEADDLNFNEPDEEEADGHLGDPGTNEDEDGTFANILSLKLKKPKHWKWELTTSKSCTNIALPRILLYDHKGQLLVDANSQEEQIFKQAPLDEHDSSRNSSRKRERKPKKTRSATTNLEENIKATLDKEFEGLRIAEVTPSPEPPALLRKSKSKSSRSIDFFTHELPDYKYERRSSSVKEVRFKDPRNNPNSSNTSFNLSNLPTPPSTSTPTGTTPSSSSTGLRERKRFRRSHSSNRSPAESPSILERFSFRKGRSSSPEYADEKEVRHSPRYYLSHSHIGTIIVKEDSFSRYRRRRRPRNSSTENLQKTPTSSNKNLETLENSPNSSLRSRSRTRRKQKPIQRLLSDGNLLGLKDQLSTSEEENSRQMTISPNRKKPSKRDLLRLDSGVSSTYTGK